MIVQLMQPKTVNHGGTSISTDSVEQSSLWDMMGMIVDELNRIIVLACRLIVGTTE